MAFTPEVVYVLLEGGSVLVITDVTDEKSFTEVVIYDGETYRDDFIGGIPEAALTSFPQVVEIQADVSNPPTGDLSDGILLETGDPTPTYIFLTDAISHIPPRYKGKQRTLCSFPRASKFTHITWADLIQGTSALAPYRLGMTPTPIV